MRFLLLNVYWLIIWVNACTLFFAQYFCSSNKYIYLNILLNLQIMSFGIFVKLDSLYQYLILRRTCTCLTVEWLPFSGYREYTLECFE